MTTRPEILTIGHSNLPIDTFIGLLRTHEVAAVADVRSSPFSRYSPQFNRGPLRSSLAASGIQYVYLGKELGARSDDPSCYEGTRVQYRRLAATELFRTGIDRVERGASRYRLALMCAEKEPLDCHRTILVARELVARGNDVAHILSDGSIEPHARAMQRLLEQLGLPAQDMFRSAEDILAEAYSRQGEKIAYDRSAADKPTTEGAQGRHIP